MWRIVVKAAMPKTTFAIVTLRCRRVPGSVDVDEGVAVEGERWDEVGVVLEDAHAAAAQLRS
jgi:hypothetical protein